MKNKFIISILFLLFCVNVDLFARMNVHSNIPFSSFPEALRKNASKHPLDKGFIDVTKPPYSLDNTGRRDVTEALRRVVEDGFWNNLVVFFPEGTYLLSGRIKCYQHQEPVKGRGASQRKYGHKLVGSQKGKRPVFKLKDGSKLEENLLFDFRWHGAKGGAPSRQYIATFRNLDIDSGDNPNATLLSMNGAQNCVIEDVRLYGKRFANGIHKVPGSGGSITKVAITGGDTGIHCSEYRPCPQLTGITLVGQKNCGLRITGARGPVTVTGFSIVSPDNPESDYRAVSVKNTLIWGQAGLDQGRANLCMIDGSITQAGKSPAIESEARSVILRNTYIKAIGGMRLIDSKGKNLDVTSDGSWKRYPLFVWSAGGEPDAVYVNGVDRNKNGTGCITEVAGVGMPPADLVSRHVWKRFPHWEESGIVDIRKYGATPDDDSDDDSAAIQKAIDSVTRKSGKSYGRTVFIPRGHFHVRKTVTMKPGLRMIGAGNNISVIQAHKDWKPKTVGSVLDSVNSPVAGVTLGYFAVMGENNSSSRGVEAQKNLSIFRLRLPGSIIRNVQIVRFSIWSRKHEKVFKTPAIIFEGYAGATVYNLCHDDVVRHSSQGNEIDAGYRTILVKGTKNPITFYEPSVEHMQGTPPQVELLNCENVKVYSFKYESEDHLLTVKNSRNIEIIGGSGNYGILRKGIESVIRIEGGTGILIGNLMRKKVEEEIEGKDWLIDDRGVAISDDRPLLLYYKGRLKLTH